ncbi:MAG TPA: fatty acid desaturase [Rhizobiaceae bacterium]|nr:fatty acid desaturase [Rhizobiaceae bacterium]
MATVLAGDIDAFDHRDLIASIPDDMRAQLTERRDVPGLLRFAVHFGVVLALATAMAIWPTSWPWLVVPQGVLIVFLFTALHETIHDTAFASPWLNRATGWVCAAAIALPPLWFRYFHLAHHRHTHDPRHDPELASPKPENWREYLIYLSGWRYWSGMAKVVAVNALQQNRDVFVPERRHGDIAREARILLGVYAALAAVSIAASSDLLLKVWIAPVLLGQPFLRAYLLAEHARCPHVENMLSNTRTTFTTAFVRFIAWNMPYHAEHHSWPAVPFHRLPALHAFARERLQVTENGYARFHAVYAATLGAGKRRNSR